MPSSHYTAPVKAPLKSLCIACAVVASALCAAAEGAPESVLEGIVRERLEASETPACVAVGVVGARTQEVFACTSGIAAVPFDRNSIFEIGSITKGLTGLLLADMVRKGEVSLDDPASKYSRPGAKLPAFEGKDITLRDIVTQTSGLPRLPAGFKPANPRNPYADFDADALYAALARTELTRPIGKAAGYSNFAFMWLSEMLARRGGKPFDVLLKERILDPLGMTDTSIVQSSEQRKRMVTPHALPYEAIAPWDFSGDLGGVGAVRSTLADMLRLASALAGRSETPLKETIALALEPMRPAELSDNATGYGWVTFSRGDIRIHWHNGGTGGSRSMLAANPRTKSAAVVLVDSAVTFDDLAMHLVEFGLPMSRKHIALPMDAALREQYVGRYQFAPARILDVFVDGERLMTRMTGQGPIELGREGSDTFFTRGVDATLEFHRNADKAIEAVTIRQNGRATRAPRMP
jgi:D-alanyl-D-alanine-carboxypeptidase/D-alanyl-D-alanine-endopeptidase